LFAIIPMNIRPFGHSLKVDVLGNVLFAIIPMNIRPFGHDGGAQSQ
jgi:predicted secreted protein